MVATLCSSHPPLGSLFPKLNFPFSYKIPTTLFISFSNLTTKPLLVLLKLFKLFLQIIIGILDGILYHLISFNPKILSIKVIILYLFKVLMQTLACCCSFNIFEKNLLGIIMQIDLFHSIHHLDLFQQFQRQVHYKPYPNF